MPRTKETRNPLGSILEKQITKHGRKIKVFDVRKRYRDETGIYKDKSKRCYSYAEALVALQNMPGEIARIRTKAAISTKTTHTLGDLTDYFRREYLKPAVFVGDKQIEGYRQNISNIETILATVEEFFGREIDVASLSYEDMRRLAVHMATTPSKLTGKLPQTPTVNRKLAYVRRLLNVGKQLRWIPTNPFTEGRPLIDTRAEKVRDRALTYQEEQLLLDQCTGRRSHLRLIVLLAIDSGLRSKEIFSLKRSDFHLDEHIIDVPARITKALKRRIVVISPRLEPELQGHFSKFNLRSHDLIFFGHKDCGSSFVTACKLAGIEGLTFHGLRHTAATWMDEAGISHAAKKNMIGHSSERVHQNYHTPTSDIIASIRDKMARFEIEKNARLG